MAQVTTFIGRYFAIYALFTLGYPSYLNAGPISYEGGWIFSTDNQEDSVNWQLSYSPKPWISLGIDYAHDKENNQSEAKDYLLPRANLLLKRWNERDSQGNIYLYAAAGGLRTGNENSFVWMTGIDADWETRRYYTAARAQIIDSPDYKEQSLYQARVGIAPYLSNFEDLHTWLIFQVQYLPESFDEKLRAGPIMRFFIENVLWEVGVTSRGMWMFNTMVHF